jgi:hypothetical protein
MKSTLNVLILIFILTAICSEICSDFLLLKVSFYHIEYSQSDSGVANVPDSPFCFDNDTKDISEDKPKSDIQPVCFCTDHISPHAIFRLSTYSLFIWQPPKTA